jgi:hypothetical protein
MRSAIVGLIALFFAIPAYAQFTIPGADTALSLSLSPRYPAPGQTIQITIQSFLYDLDSSTITWTEDGKVIAGGEGVKQITVTAGALGSARAIHVDVVGSNGTASSDVVIAPASIDLLWEADSYVPPFYKGRALPSAGGQVRIAAVPHLIRANGSSVSNSDIIYTWRKDNQILESASGRGKSSLTVDGPTLFGSETILVDASAADGTLAAETVLRIGDTKPSLVLYKDHPLYGILFDQALGASTFIPDNEMTFAAIPYFAPVRSTADKNLIYVWGVNQNSVKTDTAHQDELTINAASSTGVALISLDLSHQNNFYFGVTGQWQVTLNSRGSVIQNPFQ